MALRIKQASEGKVFAYENENNEEVRLGSVLYLGVNDDESRYYEVDQPVEEVAENGESGFINGNSQTDRETI